MIEVLMTETYSKSRQRAENAFSAMLTQAQFFAKNHAAEELEAVAQARDAKTQRLREARLAKESEERMAATAVNTAGVKSR